MTTALVRTHDSAREMAADRFLARLAALPPEGWGRLDAIARRGSTLVGRLQRSYEFTRGLAEGMHHAAPRADEVARISGRARTLEDLHGAQPGAAPVTLELLETVLLSLIFRDRMPARAFARLYAPVAPVIPLASVDP